MIDNRIELTRIPIIKRLLTRRWLQWSLVVAMLPLFLLAILTGLFGTPAGNRNFGIVFVWIVWWALLMLVLVPFAGRLWCAVCPIPAPGEWLQRRAFITPRSRGQLFTRRWKWPKRLNNIWLQNLAFILVALFSKLVLTTPWVSALVLLSFAGIAVVTSLLYERRVFCRYICPVGGFIGLYAQLAPVELRVKDRSVCAAHQDKTCYTGSDAGYGCPWLVFPATLDKNTYCGFCTECLKTCPKDNIGLFARPFGADVESNKGRRLDEAYRALMMLACAPVYSVVFMGPWAPIKEAAYAVGTPAWWAYAVGLLAVTLGIVPGIFYICTWLAKRFARASMPARRLFVEFAYTLLPLGLTAWMAFNVSFILVNISYAWSVVSDPFGWGWNLFGTADWNWTPYLPGLQPFFQVPILLMGLVLAIRVALRTTRQLNLSQLAAISIVAFCVAFTGGMMYLYV